MDIDETPSQPYAQTAAAHIRELSAVKEQLPELLRTAAITISLLTQHPIPPPDTPISVLSTQQGRADLIEAKTSALFTQINRIRFTLKNQVRDIEKEKIVLPEAARFIAAPRIEGQTEEDRERERLKDIESHVTNGGLGNLDVGVLNANVRSGRGGDGEDEVHERIGKVLEGVKTGAGVQTETNDNDQMLVDG